MNPQRRSDDDWGPAHAGRADGTLTERIGRRIRGSPDRLGWWTLPMFIAVGLLGAVLAGSLAVVYYSQRVAALERETAEARQELAGAVDRVSEAAEEAVAAIEEEAASVLDRVAADPPVEEAVVHGLVAVRASVVVEEPRERPPETDPDDQASDGEDGEAAGEDDTGEGGDETAGDDEPDPPPEPRRRTRYGSGFAVIADDDGVFVVTAFAVVADPSRPGNAVERAEVLVGGETVEAQVHSWDADRDVALLRTGPIAGMDVAEWRPADEPLSPGDQVFAAGMTPRASLMQLRATIAAADADAIHNDLAIPDVLRGGPLLDGQGRVAGVVSSAYEPYGESGAVSPDLPVRLLCERLIRCGDEDLGAG